PLTSTADINAARNVNHSSVPGSCSLSGSSSESSSPRASSIRSAEAWSVTDERLCWLIVRDELHRRSGKLRFLGWITVLSSRRASGAAIGGEIRRERLSDKMSDHSVAVDASAQTLSPDERRHLRTAAQVPDWFRADVERRYQE